MSRHNRSNVIDLSKEQSLYGVPNRTELHASKLFFVRKKKGVLLNKLPELTRSITILNERLEDICTDKTVYFFDDDRLDHMLLIETIEGDYVEFVFSPSDNDFVERKSELMVE